MDILNEKFNLESGRDINTLLVFMAGCAIRERVIRIKEHKDKVNKNLVSKDLAKPLIEDDFNLIRDFAKVIATIEADYETKNKEDRNAYIKSNTDFIINKTNSEINRF